MEPTHFMKATDTWKISPLRDGGGVGPTFI